MSFSGPDRAPRTQPVRGDGIVAVGGPAPWLPIRSAQRMTAVVVGAMTLLAASVSASRGAMGSDAPPGAHGIAIAILGLAACVGLAADTRTTDHALL